MKRKYLCVLLALGIQLIGCSLFQTEQASYLHSAQNQASEQDVRNHLGAPVAKESGPEGESVWVYQVREQQPGNRMTAPGMWCDEYVLTFDQQSILRGWTHRSYFHGGEFMPTYCVPGGYGAKS